MQDKIDRVQEMIRIEKVKDRPALPYQVLLGDLVVALCPSAFTAMLVSGGLNHQIEFERKKERAKKWIRYRFVGS